MGTSLNRKARVLRAVHNAIGIAELGCLVYLWFCGITRRRDRWLVLAALVLVGEGTALLIARECPFGPLQRRAGDDVAMFELWFGPRIAPFAVPTFTVMSVTGMLLVLVRRPEAVPGASRSLQARTAL
jgi:hypothetical protein